MFFILLRKLVNRVVDNKTIILILLIMIFLVFAVYTVEYQNGTEYFQTWWDAIRWAFITSTTIGYGDKFPVTFRGQVFAMIYIFLTLGIIGDVALKITNALFVKNEKKMNGTLPIKFSNHTIIYGEPNSNTYSIINQLYNEDNSREMVFLSETDKMPSKIENMQGDGVKIHFIKGDPKNDESLNFANVDKAKDFIILSKDIEDPDKDTLAYIMNIRMKNQNINILSEIKDDNNNHLFGKAGADNVINSSLIGHRLFVRSLTDNVDDVIYQLLDNRYGKEVYQVELDSKWHENKLWELIEHYLKENFQIVAIRSKGDNDLYFNKDYKIQDGDIAYIISEERIEKI